MDYETYIYDKYTKKVKELSKKIDEELLPFYKLHLLIEKIETELKDVSEENIGELLNNTRLLLDALNSINTHNSDEKNRLIKNAYEVIYQVILYEEIFDRSDILSYINYLNIPVNKENIGRLLSKDLKKLDRKVLIDEDLKSIKSEGLGYDYLTENLIRKVSRLTVGEENSEYQRRKKETIQSLKNDVIELSNRKKDKMDTLNSLRNERFKLYAKKGMFYTKFLSLVMIPVITFSAGKAIGKAESNKIDEYKTYTRTVNLNTGKVVGDVKEEWDENETTYVATIIEYSPWRLNPTGSGYISNVTAYEYITPKNVDENYHISKKDISGNIRQKYSFVEPKEVLEENDSLTESTILVTETYQDKSISKKSVKFVVPFAVTGAILGILADIALILLNLGIYDTDGLERILKKLNEKIEENNGNIDDVKNTLLEIKEEALGLQKRYNEAVRKYGSLADQFIFEDIDTSFIKRK